MNIKLTARWRLLYHRVLQKLEHNSAKVLLGTATQNWEYRPHKWCVLGDSNEFLFAHETIRTRERPPQQMSLFWHTIETLDVAEIFMEATTYTWWNRRKGTQLYLINVKQSFWQCIIQAFKSTHIVKTFPTTTSDHHAIQLDVQCRHSTGNVLPPVRFEPLQLNYIECLQIIQNGWTSLERRQPREFLNNLEGMKFQLKEWSHRKLGIVPKEI